MISDIQTLDAFARETPMSLRDSIFHAATKELLGNHPELSLGKSLIRFVVTHLHECQPLLWKHMFNAFLDQHHDPFPAGSVLEQPAPGQQEPERHMTPEVLRCYTRWLVQHDFLTEDVAEHAHVLLTTRSADETWELCAFHALLDRHMPL